jgi:hypothetical protein
MSNGKKPTITQGRNNLSHFLSNIRAKLNNPGFQKDLTVYGTIASIIPVGRILKTGAGLLSGGFLAPAGKGKGMVNFGSDMIGAFRNTPIQYSSKLPPSLRAMFSKNTNVTNRYIPPNYAPQIMTTKKIVDKKNLKLKENLIKSAEKFKGEEFLDPLYKYQPDPKIYNKL